MARSASSVDVERPSRRGRARRRRARACRIAATSSAVRPRSTNTFDRDSSAAFTSNDGFSVVAPISTMSPASTRGRKASCCALLNRWISSTKTIVRRPVERRSRSASAITSRISLMPASTALNETNRAFVVSAMMRASVVLPVPGGPHRMIDCSRSRSIASRSGLPGASSSSWPTNSSNVRGRMRSASGAVGSARSRSRRRPEQRCHEGYRPMLTAARSVFRHASGRAFDTARSLRSWRMPEPRHIGRFSGRNRADRRRTTVVRSSIMA